MSSLAADRVPTHTSLLPFCRLRAGTFVVPDFLHSPTVLIGPGAGGEAWSPHSRSAQQHRPRRHGRCARPRAAAGARVYPCRARRAARRAPRVRSVLWVQVCGAGVHFPNAAPIGQMRTPRRRHRERDFHFSDELLAAAARGDIDLHTAFSRDAGVRARSRCVCVCVCVCVCSPALCVRIAGRAAQAAKVYVQHNILENRAEFARLFVTQRGFAARGAACCVFRRRA